MANISASPRIGGLSQVADFLRQAKTGANSLSNGTDVGYADLLAALPRVPAQRVNQELPEQANGLGTLLFGSMPEELTEWSYGNTPFQMTPAGTGSLIPQIKQGRAQGLLDTTLNLAPGVVAGGAMLAKPVLNPVGVIQRTGRNIGRVAIGSDPVKSALSEIARYELPVERAAASSPRGWVGPVEIGDMTSVAYPRSGLLRASDQVHTHPRGLGGAYNPLSAGDIPKDGTNLHVIHTNRETGIPTKYRESLAADALPPSIGDGMTQSEYVRQLLENHSFKTNVPDILYNRAGDLTPDLVAPGKMNIVKSKGGNWLKGSLDDALEMLKSSDLIYEGHPGTAISNRINNWVDRKLGKYIRNDMGTLEDPVRKLADQGILHLTPGQLNDLNTAKTRTKAGYRREAASDLLDEKDWGSSTAPGTTHGTEAGKIWEDISDARFRIHASEDIAEDADAIKNNTWLSSLGEDVPVYDIDNGDLEALDDLGFPHLVDELSNAINPDSGLPRHLQFPADRLDKVTVPQAVQRVSEINAWRAAQQAEADAQRANNAATVLHKEYPDNNPQGLKWVELKGADPALYKESTMDQYNLANEQLKDALKYEGDTMGHCVGGYCDDVASGHSRIYSLRDAKGHPHVTIETSSTKTSPMAHVDEDEAAAALEAELSEYYPDLADRMFDAGDDMYDLLKQEQPALWDKYFAPQEQQRIVQIKGKQNRAPKEEYLPFVQDFVKNGEWSHIGDFKNAGLYDIKDHLPDIQARAKAAGFGRYLTSEELDTLINASKEL